VESKWGQKALYGGVKLFRLKVLKSQNPAPEMSRNKGLEATLSFGGLPTLNVVCGRWFLDIFGYQKAQNESYNDCENTGSQKPPTGPGRGGGRNIIIIDIII